MVNCLDVAQKKLAVCRIEDTSLRLILMALEVFLTGWMEYTNEALLVIQI